MFSRRTAWPNDPSPFASVVEHARARDAIVFDLTTSNPTQVGLRYEPGFYRELFDERNAEYVPEPLGLTSAREAITLYYRERDVVVRPEHVLVTASTSEAYLLLLDVLCDSGDAVLVPRPGYPLFDHIAALAGVELLHYPLQFVSGAWQLDLDAIARTVQRERVRAIVVVAPNNPTGSCLDHRTLNALMRTCETRELALVVDQVFADYPLRDDPERVTHVGGALACPTFVLSGLSKIAALPQLKLSWIVAHGPNANIQQAMQRLEVVADTFLSTSTLAQLALPYVLERAPDMQARIRARLHTNMQTLHELTRASALQVPDVDAGWTVLLRLPAVRELDDAAWAQLLLLQDGVLVQPGYLYDLSGTFVVLSLLTEPHRFVAGVTAIRQRVTSLL